MFFFIFPLKIKHFLHNWYLKGASLGNLRPRAAKPYYQGNSSYSATKTASLPYRLLIIKHSALILDKGIDALVACLLIQ